MKCLTNSFSTKSPSISDRCITIIIIDINTHLQAYQPLAKVIVRLIHSRMYLIPCMIDILKLPLHEIISGSAKYNRPFSFFSIYWSKPSNHSSFMFSILEPLSLGCQYHPLNSEPNYHNHCSQTSKFHSFTPVQRSYHDVCPSFTVANQTIVVTEKFHTQLLFNIY